VDWQRQAENLAAGLDVSERWRPAFAATPRHLFVPRFFKNHPERGWYAVDRTGDDYLDWVYRNEALITQLDGDPESWEKARRDGVYVGGHVTSSSSTPGLMAAMLDALHVEPGMTVLEIGTGTGYNAAILCRQLGDKNVTTIDIDPRLIESARVRLTSLGYRPTCKATNAVVDIPGGPYDRIISTVGVRRVPYGWLTAAKPGGLILVNLYSDLATNAIFALTVHGDGMASGQAPIGGTFMPTRDNIMPFSFTLHDKAEGTRTPTQLPGSVLDDFGPFYLFASLIMRDVQLHYFPHDDELRPGLLDRDRSWAYELNGNAIHGGPRNLWSQLEEVHAIWEHHGRPSREQLGLTVTKDQQTLWLNSPDQIITTEIDAVSVRRL
jgi:protein-L-isoaspartate(D-aspartate) O-methyltransferase